MILNEDYFISIILPYLFFTYAFLYSIQVVAPIKTLVPDFIQSLILKSYH